MKKITAFVIIIVVIYSAWWMISGGIYNNSAGEATNFTECLKSGGVVMESYPRQCRNAAGQTFTEDIGNELEKQNLITIDNPRPNQIITSPLSISGQARGYWFFEADFPVKIYDNNGQILGNGIAIAQDEWMTENFVPFSLKLTFDPPNTEQGTIVFEKDNPSGLSENEDSLIMPVQF
ncbi:Gmad2 immunoglobulin-like domain-containing protein [bacterium]|nr:Gmad2 immunoglobulin-like domain-containing protein [bacterium]